MGKLEKHFIYTCVQTFSIFYCRITDDIFLLWNGRETQLLDFITRLNYRKPAIKFDLNIQNPASTSQTQKSTKTKGRTTYWNPKNGSKFLDPNSARPKSFINSIPFNQALRLKNICLETSELNKYLNELKESFINRDYKKNMK